LSYSEMLVNRRLVRSIWRTIRSALDPTGA
jgi:hypothetical protein